MKIIWHPTAIPTVDVGEIADPSGNVRVFHRIKRGSKTVYRFNGNEYPTMNAAWMAGNGKAA